ncbi:hypothetical protein EDB19DRAFT_1999006, partial [Suillus lakei]
GCTGWTVTHGFFVWMGGFMLHIDGEPRATLTSDELLRLIREGFVEMPIIAEADIEDRSKGDVLSKGVAVFQLLWFVLQLAARYVQNLQVTLLEIDTLAVTVMTCIAYRLWWKKPKDVGRPYTVHLRSALPRDLRLTYDKAHLDGSNAGRTSLFTYVMHPFIRLMGTEEIAPLPARSWHVPSIGGYGDYLRVPIGCLGGIVFGGVHCLGWNYLFQKHTEQILWRAASLGIVCTPVCILLDFEYFSWLKEKKRMDGFHKVFVICVGLISGFIYVSARVTLLVLMLNLRSLPPGVYDTVAWSQLVPH